MWKFTLEEGGIVLNLVKMNKTKNNMNTFVALAAEGAQKSLRSWEGEKCLFSRTLSFMI